jgi:hypothetical protein
MIVPKIRRSVSRVKELCFTDVEMVIGAAFSVLLLTGTSTFAACTAEREGGPRGEVHSPLPPKEYIVPPGATVVSTSEEFKAVFSSTTPQDIVLENGYYRNSQYLIAGAAHRVWSRELGGATLSFGLVFGGRGKGGGGEVHGLRLLVSDKRRAFKNAVLATWGMRGENTKVEDSWISGGNVVGAGIAARSTKGLVVQRVVASGFTNVGIMFMASSPAHLADNPRAPPVVSDVEISDVYRTSRGSSKGTAEAGLWIGTKSIVERVRVSNVGWMGSWIGGNANCVTLSDFEIDNAFRYTPGAETPIGGVGLYIEHWTRESIFQSFRIGPKVAKPWEEGHMMGVGIASEWGDPAYGRNPHFGESLGASQKNIIQNGMINSKCIGVSLEDAVGTRISGVRFENQRAAAIKEYESSGKDHDYDTEWQNNGNSFDISPSAKRYSRSHRPTC